MKRVQLHRVAAGGASIDERYIVEMFDDEQQSDARPVALGYALFRPRDGACSVKVVSRGAHDERHAQAALAAFQKFVAAARLRASTPIPLGSALEGRPPTFAGDRAVD